MKRFLLSLIFLIYVSAIYSQKNQNENKTVKGISENKSPGPKAQPNRMAPSNRYLGKEETIKKIMVDGRIPKSFPSFDEKRISKEAYEFAVMDWLKEHKDLIKPEYHQKIVNKLTLFDN